MTHTIAKLTQAFEESLNDLLLSRSERKELRGQIADQKLSPHQQQVLLSEVRKMALAKSETAREQKLIEWMYESFKVLNSAIEEKEGTKSYFSPGSACREAISSQVRFAREEIRICVFTISDDRITEELIAAHRRGKSIRIITDNDKAFDLGSDIARMEREGIQIRKDRTDVHMHHKFALIDDETLITGSYNWTRSAAEHNYENIILVKAPASMKAYEHEFERLWEKFE